MDIHHGYQPWKGDGNTSTNTTFGHADWHAAQSQGKSASEIANWARANQHIMSPGEKNLPGGGGLFDQIMAAEKSARSSGGGGGGGGRGGGGGSGYTAPTYDQGLSYEGYNNPGDNPYTSNYEPKQVGYMNDLSILSPEELVYREGNIRGLDDRIYTSENPGASLNNYIFSIKEELNKTPETKVDTISRESNNESNKLYGRSYEENPYDKYDSSRYY